MHVIAALGSIFKEWENSEASQPRRKSMRTQNTEGMVVLPDNIQVSKMVYYHVRSFLVCCHSKGQQKMKQYLP